MTEVSRSLAEVLRQVRRVELRTRGLVASAFAGEYHSVFRGQGMEFAEVRAYVEGDDVRAIDWNVSARMGAPYVKRFVEERELTLLLVADLSASQRWGSGGRRKDALLPEFAAHVGISAARNQDRVGLLGWSAAPELFVAPGKGRRHALRIVRDLLLARPRGSGTDLAGALERAGRILRTRGVVFVVSDFRMEGGAWAAFERQLARLSAGHDVVPVVVEDPAEAALPAVGVMRVRDPETGAATVLDTSSDATRRRFAEAAARRAGARAALFRRRGLDAVHLRPEEPVAPALLAFARLRERRRAR